MLNLKAIQCKDRIYITEEREDRRYFNIDFSKYLFDDKKAEKTNRADWYKLDKIPTKITEKQPDKTENHRYVLKENYTPNDIMPAIIDLLSLEDTEYEEMRGLYKREYDTIIGGYEEVEFEIDIIYKKDDFEWLKSNFKTNYSLISQIEYHPDLLQEAPCMVTSEVLYSLIRNYIKTNIDKRYAEITSDYDSHFGVAKKITIAEPYSYTIDTNNSIFDKRKKKPKWITEQVTNKKQTILNIKNNAKISDYGKDCYVPEPIYGTNQIDLENKVNEYLEDLLSEINKNYIECPHCLGWGIIEENEDEKNV